MLALLIQASPGLDQYEYMPLVRVSEPLIAFAVASAFIGCLINEKR
jgi:hypothetical protein